MISLVKLTENEKRFSDVIRFAEADAAKLRESEKK